MSLSPFLSGERVAQTRSPGRVAWSVADLPFTTYVFGDPDASRPYFHPLIGPGGAAMTRGFPMRALPGETTDHPHHRSLWAAFGEVNGSDNWGDGKGHAVTRHRDDMTTRFERFDDPKLLLRRYPRKDAHMINSPLQRVVA